MSRRARRQSEETPTRPVMRMALNRQLAAEYVGLSATTFDKMVTAGHFPKPRRYPDVRRYFWLASELEATLREMPFADGSTGDPWAGVGDDPWEGVEL